jgi:hypothetical protein
VPLSEHEQRLLEQMERALYAEDPKFATSMRTSRAGRGDRRKAVVGFVSFLLGLVLLMFGVVTKVIPVGVLGFAAMLAGVFFAWSGISGPNQGSPLLAPADESDRRRPGFARGRSARGKSSDSLSERMESRWRRRREIGDF